MPNLCYINLESPANKSEQNLKKFKSEMRPSKYNQHLDFCIKNVDFEIDDRVADKSTADKFGQTLEEFLNYIDTHFKPEINLTESEVQLFSFMQNNPELHNDVKLTYRGNKRTTDKGKHSERRDVLYKTFIRTIRRYLCSIFENEFCDLSKIKQTNSNLFKTNVTAFYDKYFRKCASSQIGASKYEHEYFCFLLGVMITNKISFPSKTDEMKRQLYLFQFMLKKFCSTSYPKFFSSKLIPELFALMKSSGVISKCIKAYPKLNQSREAYVQIVESIVDFKKIHKSIINSQSLLHEFNQLYYQQSQNLA